MDDDKLLQINLNIAGRPFKLTIKWKDEYKYRQAAKEVNEKYDMYSKTLSDPFDRLALIAFQHTFEKNDKMRGEELSTSRDKINELTALLDSVLEQE